MRCTLLHASMGFGLQFWQQVTCWIPIPISCWGATRHMEV